jgi:hypothetical protein
MYNFLLTSGGAPPPEGTRPKPGRKASQEGTETDPEEKWMPKELGRCLQRDDPSCSGGMTQKHFINKGDVPGILWIPDKIRRSPQRDDPLCRSGTAQGNRHRKKPHQGQD